MLIYVAGPYTAPTEEEIEKNIEQAARVAAELWDKGHAVICPHTNTAHFEERCLVAGYDSFVEGCLTMMSMCDAIVLVPGWEHSLGAVFERDTAARLGIPIYYYPDLPGLHPTEVRSPMQAKAFREILGLMYRTHLSKNADYSPLNLLLTGSVGLVTRIWDKTARLLNLIGFRAQCSVGTYETPREPKNESIADTYMDLAVYAVIGLLLKDDKWGR